MISKNELVELLEQLNIPISEGTPEDTEMDSEIRLCYWDYIWDPIETSGTEYDTVVTYQISVIADRPRHPKLIELRNLLLEHGIITRFNHEYLNEKRRVHSFCSIDVEEKIA